MDRNIFTSILFKQWIMESSDIVYKIINNNHK